MRCWIFYKYTHERDNKNYLQFFWFLSFFFHFYYLIVQGELDYLFFSKSLFYSYSFYKKICFGFFWNMHLYHREILKWFYHESMVSSILVVTSMGSEIGMLDLNSIQDLCIQFHTNTFGKGENLLFLPPSYGLIVRVDWALKSRLIINLGEG